MTGKPCLSLRVKIIGLCSFTGQGYYTQKEVYQKAGWDEREGEQDLASRAPKDLHGGGGKATKIF